MTIPKHDVIRLRLTALEKQDWAKAAGGKGKLSEWIRAICNAAAENSRLDGTALLNNAIQTLKPQVVEDAIQREVRGGIAGTLGQPDTASEDQAHRGSRSLPVTQAEGGDSPPGDRKATAGASAPASAQCARWFHHKDGVYCGACKKVIGR